MDDSSPFCPNCGTAQIRFSGGESSSLKVTVPVPVERFDFSGPVPPPPIPAIRLHKRTALRSAFVAGVIAALISILPLGVILGAPAGGFLSVLLYRRRSLLGDPPPGSGFRLGALAGLFGCAIFILLVSAEILLFHGENEMRNGMIEAVHRQQARNPDPQARQMLDYFMTPHGMIIMMIGGLVFVAILFVLLSGLGGTVSAMLLRRKDGPNQ